MIVGLNIMSVALVSVLQGLVIPVIVTLNDAGEVNGYALAAIGGGLLIGGVIYTLVGTKLNPWILLVFATVLNVAVLAVLVQFASIPLTIALCFAFGLTSSFVGAITGVVSITLMPENMRGRINSFQNSSSMIVGPVAVFGLAWVISVSSVTAAGVMLVAVWSTLWL